MVVSTDAFYDFGAAIANFDLISVENTVRFMIKNQSIVKFMIKKHMPTKWRMQFELK